MAIYYSFSAGPNIAVFSLIGEITIEPTRPIVMNYCGGIIWFFSWFVGFVVPYMEVSIEFTCRQPSFHNNSVYNDSHVCRFRNYAKMRKCILITASSINDNRRMTLACAIFIILYCTAFYSYLYRFAR